ncbi:AAWKG family protein [Streptomyces castrisilvae]|uniref:AAWKG family protein n=1 Tax=Streptomyces castrisilvae TaxID=3033811 RepID=A0ABY9HSI3_9ACTN|nr:AAWKG family protein [Streptomyces sp. Mut1]WLQ37271.1 AAWKG family protein [Streptomyces sp. Mut1]
MADDGKSTSGTPTYDPDDYYGQAITNFTGYTIPARSSLFNSLSSDSGDDFSDLKLFRMEISGQTMRAVSTDDYTRLSGFQQSTGEDYDLAFYDAGGDGAHDSVSLKKARIVMIGVGVGEDGRADLWGDGAISGGGEFEGSYSHVQWDSGPMAQYISGSKLALDELLNNHTTKGWSFSNLSVLDGNAVEFKSFEETGQSFDRAMQFFKDHSDVVNGWMKSLGEDQAAWKGKAASLFWHLLKELKTNYDGYVSQLGGRDYSPKNTTVGGYVPKSKLSDALAAAQTALKDAVTDLQTAWNSWAKDGKHDPHRHLVKVLDEVSAFVLKDNIQHVNVKTQYYGGYGGGGSYKTYSTTSEFKQTSAYGDLTQHTTWKKIADAAVKSWSDHADSVLKQPAIDALSNVKSAWADVTDAFDQEVTDKNSETLAEVLAKEEADIAKDEANANNDKLNDYLDGLNDNINTIGDGLNDLNDGLNDSLNDLGDGFKDLNDGLNDSLNGLGDGFKDLNDGLNDNLNGLNDGLNDSLNGINDGLNDSLNGLGDGLNGLGDGVNNLGDGLNNNFSTLNDGLNNGLGDGLGLNGDPDSPLGGPNPAALVPPITSLLNNDGLGNKDGKGGSSLLNTPLGGSTQLNDDGTLTTKFPDGSTQTIDPRTGLVTSTSPKGVTSTSQLNPGTSLLNPDGSTTTLNDDGTLTTTFPDGSSQTLDPKTGHVETLNPDGSLSESTLNPTDGAFSNPGGSTSQLNGDGTLTTKFPDGSMETLNPDTGQVTVTDPSGNVTTHQLNPGESFTNPDGSTTTLNNDGTLTTEFPDGSKQVLDPDTGRLTTTDAAGHTTTTDLNGDGPSLNTRIPDLDSLNHNGPDTDGLNTQGLDGPHTSSPLTHSSGLNTHGPGGSLNTSGGPDSNLDDYYDDYDSTPYGGGSLGSANPGAAALAGNPAAQSANGTPLNPMGMGGGGMPGMGGAGGGGQGTSERTRAVLTDPVGGARGGRGGRAAGVDEDEEIVYTRPTTSSSPYPVGGPGAAGQGCTTTESGDRAREAWLAEDDDVWGTDDGGAPAVIGR